MGSDRVTEQKEDGKCEQMLETVEVKDKVEEGKELECPLQAHWRSFTLCLIPASCVCVCIYVHVRVYVFVPLCPILINKRRKLNKANNSFSL